MSNMSAQQYRIDPIVAGGNVKCGESLIIDNVRTLNRIEYLDGRIEVRDARSGAIVEASRWPIVRAFSCAGPCLILGRLTKETAKFYCFEEWRGGDKYEGAKKVAKPLPGKYSGNHVEPCPSCRDHAKTMYPNGLMD